MPPASNADIQNWETRYGVTLPKMLAAALQQQNGGEVRGAGILIYTLNDLEPLSGNRWEHIWRFGNEDFLPAERLVAFAMYDGGAGSLILNYNAGPEPHVVVLWHDLGDELSDDQLGSFDNLVPRHAWKVGLMRWR